ncbi:hypothetical protein QUF81_14675 [Peribacillus simplex]|uniref:Ribbon-helix-helix domain-containing protein n=1 Tax=Peribacillus simplex TaxID=1478 RepID=A0AAW7IBC3_9BACI|nr:hypothetical protein [Peribacillus simplex]SNT48688.1 hypothetical protein SAMN05444672_13234 [Bacillus sp. OK838]AMM93396.1 hypothetical protein UP17_13650 [Peribacillus simplex]MDF9761136.1 hypothetical protein [Peribacillus simplex]MDM5294415.1 hypothetical protein [Peribacillus simplex]MDM5453363.1 hypothetical protein [Peribacillus simplex]
MEINERQPILSPKLIHELEILSSKTNMSIPELLEISVVSLLEKVNNTKEVNVGLNNKEMILRNKIIINQNREVLNNQST